MRGQVNEVEVELEVALDLLQQNAIKTRGWSSSYSDLPVHNYVGASGGRNTTMVCSSNQESIHHHPLIMHSLIKQPAIAQTEA